MTAGDSLDAQRTSGSERWRAVVRMDRLPPAPQLPLHGHWQVGLSDVLRASAGMPADSARALGLVDRVARLAISPQQLTLDGDTHRWADILALHTAPAVDVLTSSALESELSRLGGRLPPVPGRRWLVARVSQVMIGLTAGVLEAALAPGGFAAAATNPPIPTRLVVRGRFGRSREDDVGLFPALICASLPGVAAAVTHIAAANGIQLVAAPPAASRRYADRVAETLRGLRSSQTRLE